MPTPAALGCAFAATFALHISKSNKSKETKAEQDENKKKRKAQKIHIKRMWNEREKITKNVQRLQVYFLFFFFFYWVCVQPL